MTNIIDLRTSLGHIKLINRFSSQSFRNYRQAGGLYFIFYIETFLANQRGRRIILMDSIVISVFKFMLFLIPICIVPAMEMCWPEALQSMLNRNNFVTDRSFANIVENWS